MLQVQRLSDNATLPRRVSAGAAGYDISSAKQMVIPAEGKGLVPTDLIIAIPNGCYGRLAPRSGVSWLNHLSVGCGCIDQDFRGNVQVVLFNHSKYDFHIKVGDRIAQLILEKIEIPDVEEVQEMNQTLRGQNGFGSSGR